MSVNDLYPYLAALAILITIGREALNALTGTDWRETAEALKLRLDILEDEINDLKAQATIDKQTISTLRRERTRDKATIGKLRQQVRQLVAALQAANIPIPRLIVLDEEPPADA